MYSITNVKADLQGVLHGTTNNQITNLTGILNRAARQLLSDLDPQETKRIEETPQIFDAVYDYSSPADLKGNKIIDIRPQVNRILLDNPGQTYSKPFDLYKGYSTTPGFNVDFDSASKTLRINYPLLNTGLTVNDASSVIGDGTWTTNGSATDLTTDNTLFAWASGSLKFNSSAGANPSTGGIVNSTMSSKNLSAHENQSHIFYYVYMPIASQIISTYVKWGSSAADYWTRTLTVNAQGETFKNGWNLIKAEWNGSTVVGAPSSAAIDYVEVGFNYDGTAQTALRVNGITSKLGKIFEIVYYSKYLFRNSANTWQETLTGTEDDTTTYVNLDTDSYNIYLDQVALLAVQQMLGQDAGFDTSFFGNRYAQGVAAYRNKYKSEIIQPKQYYYRQPKSVYRRFFGRQFNY